MREWFALTHQVVSGFGVAYWQRTALPAAGGLGDQDAWLMQALEYLRRVKDQLLTEAAQRSRNEKALADWRQGRQKNGRT